MGNRDREWCQVESCQFADNAGVEDKGYVLTSVEHRTTEESQFGQAVTFTYTVGVSPSATGSIGGVYVASGDVDGAPNAFEYDFCDGGTAATGPVVAMETLTIAHEGFGLI
jgi:hypothetical protein